MRKIKIGVLGAYRGTGMINYCKIADNAEIVAICDKFEPLLKKQQELCPEENITYYTDFDEFLQHDGLEAVVLANYANEHAPYAVKAMRAGKHVYSEVLPCQTMKEAVELIETIEETGMVYVYGENFCYMPAPYEMKRLYAENRIGEFEYGECEYIHNLESVWHNITYGDKNHWRNTWYAHFYCTHSIGPLIHITGLRPVRVTGFEGKMIERNLRVGAKSGQYGIEMIELENGGIIKSIHGGLYRDSHWYSIYGSKGRMESAREDTDRNGFHMLYVNADDYSGQYKEAKVEAYEPKLSHGEISEKFGHGGGDFYAMYYFAEKILGNEEADVIDIFEALNMFLPGMFAYRSVLAGGIPMDIPDLRDPAEREKWRNDTACTDPKVAGDMLLPCFSRGNVEIPDQVYELMKKKYLEDFEATQGYVKAALTQSNMNFAQDAEEDNNIMMGKKVKDE